MSLVEFDPGSELVIEPGSRKWPWKKQDIALTPGGALTASRLVIEAGNVHRLLGYAVAETTGAAPAAFRLLDSTQADGSVFVRVNLAANESTRDTFGTSGLHCVSGSVYLQWISGSIEGVLFWV